MRHLLTPAALLAWVLLQVPIVVCVSDRDGSSHGESILVHHHGHGEGQHTHTHDHSHEAPAEDHHDRHVIVHADTCMAGNAVALDAPTIDVANVVSSLRIELCAAAQPARWEPANGPPWAADPVSASVRLLV